jgi:uncharacterized protein YndB with AHSA1/START domain
MATRSETLARRFETKVQEAVATLEKLGETDWKHVTEAEQWSVGVTAHHLATALEPLSHMIETVAAGQAPGNLTVEMLDEMNAQHARDHADCTRAETIELLDKGAAVASAAIRRLGDDQLARSGTVFVGRPPMTVEQLITSGLLDHVDEHFGSIRNTVAARTEHGKPRGAIMARGSNVGITEFTTPSDRELVATRVVDAPRKLVWEAWTSPRHVPRWMLGPEGWTMPVCEIDLRPGGQWHFVWRQPDGSRMEMRGVYREVVAPERLVNTEAWGGDWAETLNTLVLTEEDGQTTMTCTLLYLSKEARERALATGMKDGWSASYDLLDTHLRTMG